MKKLKLGVIGSSEGNGHPYSWSAIFNGYDPEFMKDCPYPVIFDYLEKRKFPDEGISEALVTHIWTQDKNNSIHIARASKIENVCDQLVDMIGEVDGILLARDDAENHWEMARPFIEAGLPIYIDKPLCLSLHEFEKYFSLEKYSGQIFSCSALRYAKELHLTDAQKKQLGNLKSVSAETPKYWESYAIHLIDPLIYNLPDRYQIKSHHVESEGRKTSLTLQLDNDINVVIKVTGESKGSIRFVYVGDNDSIELVFKDSFTSFRSALVDFIWTIKNQKRMIPIEVTRQAVAMLEMGMNK